jgi:hypothetical protein
MFRKVKDNKRTQEDVGEIFYHSQAQHRYSEIVRKAQSIQLGKIRSMLFKSNLLSTPTDEDKLECEFKNKLHLELRQLDAE